MAKDPAEAIDPFNISDFDEEAERARLRPVDEAGISGATKKDFSNWVSRIRRSLQRKGSYRTVPEELFFADNRGSLVSRTYQKHPTRMENPRDELLADIQISRDKDGFPGALFELWGEKPNFSSSHEESLSAHFSPVPTERSMFELPEGADPVFRKVLDKVFAGKEFTKAGDKPNYNLVIRRDIDGRELYLQYDRGKIVTIGFELDNDHQSSRLHVSGRPDPELAGIELDLNELLETGHVSGKVPKSIVYDLTYKESDDEQPGIITLTKRQKGVVTDHLIIPSIVKSQQLFEELFPKPLLEDPFQAGIEWDQRWKDADLGTFGVNWDRPTPNPS